MIPSQHKMQGQEQLSPLQRQGRGVFPSFQIPTEFFSKWFLNSDTILLFI